MKRHSVGTRVVVVVGERLLGLTGVVVGHASPPAEDGYDHLVMIDNDPQPDGKPWYCEYTDLRPIRDDDANTVTSWADCIWQPDGVAA